MDIRSFFPLNVLVKPKDPVSLVITILIYVLAPTVLGILFALIGWIPVLGLLLRIISWVFSVYCLIGLIFAVLAYAEK